MFLLCRYIVSTESGNVLIWNRITEQVLFKDEQTCVRQLSFIEEATKFIAVSRPSNLPGVESTKTTATLVTRNIPGVNLANLKKKVKNYFEKRKDSMRELI